MKETVEQFLRGQPKVRDIQAALRHDGFVCERVKGSHEHWFQRDGKTMRRVTIAGKENRVINAYEMKMIRRNAGWIPSGPSAEKETVLTLKSKKEIIKAALSLPVDVVSRKSGVSQETILSWLDESIPKPIVPVIAPVQIEKIEEKKRAVKKNRSREEIRPVAIKAAEMMLAGEKTVTVRAACKLSASQCSKIRAGRYDVLPRDLNAKLRAFSRPYEKRNARLEPTIDAVADDTMEVKFLRTKVEILEKKLLEYMKKDLEREIAETIRKNK